MAQGITQTMIPIARRPRQAMAEPREFGPNNWRFNVAEAGRLNWRPGNVIQSDDNWRTEKEGWQFVKNGMFRNLTGEEQIYGHVDYSLNPLRQDQTNLPVYQQQKATRVTDNNDPAVYMRTQTNFYPSNLSNPAIFGNYKGSRI